MSTSTKTSRRGLLAAIPAMAAAIAPGAAATLSGLPTSAVADPIFAAIEAHKRAYTLFNSDPYDEDGEDLWDAYWQLLDTAPTTIAGFAAMFTYLAERDQYGYSNFGCAREYWAGIEGYNDTPPEHSDSAWLAMLADAIRKLAPLV